MWDEWACRQIIVILLFKHNSIADRDKCDECPSSIKTCLPPNLRISGTNNWWSHWINGSSSIHPNFEVVKGAEANRKENKGDTPLNWGIN